MLHKITTQYRNWKSTKSHSIFMFNYQIAE